MEQKIEQKKRGPGRPKKYEKSRVFSLRLAGEELRILDYILEKGGKKWIHDVFVASLEKYKGILERQEVRNLFRSHIQKSIKRNKRFESSAFNGYALDRFSLDLHAIFFAEKQKDEHIMNFFRRNSQKLVEKFPEKVTVSVDNGDVEEAIDGAISTLSHMLQWFQNEAFVEKVLKSEWYLHDAKDAFVLSAEYIEEKVRSLKNADQ